MAWGRRKADKRYKEFETWLDTILGGGQLPGEVVALNFNVYDGVGGTYDLELIGAPGFDTGDDDWACEELFASEMLSVDIPGETRAWEDSFLQIRNMVCHYLSSGAYSQQLKEYRAVGLGHVNGELELVYLKEEPFEYEDSHPLAPEQAPVVFLPGQDLFQGEAIEWLDPEKSEPAEEAPNPEEMPQNAVSGEDVAAPKACFKLIREMRPKNMVCRPKREYGIRHYELMRGQPFTQWDEAFTFVYDGDKGDNATDLLNNAMGWLVVSQKLRGILEEIESQIEYHAVRVEDTRTGAELPGYWVANLLRMEDALCLEESEYSVIEHEVFGSYNTVKKYALKEEALSDADIFKLPNHQEIPVFVTSRFKERMEAENITGMAYYPLKLV